MNASAVGNALSDWFSPGIMRKSPAPNVGKQKRVSSFAVQAFLAIQRLENAYRVRHRVFPEPVDDIAAVCCLKIFSGYRLFKGDNVYGPVCLSCRYRNPLFVYEA
jgi:hypothetical protein